MTKKGADEAITKGIVVKLLWFINPSCALWTLKYGEAISSGADIERLGGGPKVWQQTLSGADIVGVYGFWIAILVEYLGAIFNCLGLFLVLYFVNRRQAGEGVGVAGGGQGGGVAVGGDKKALSVQSLTKQYGAPPDSVVGYGGQEVGDYNEKTASAIGCTLSRCTDYCLHRCWRIAICPST